MLYLLGIFNQASKSSLYVFRTLRTQERSDPDAESTIECKRQEIKMKKQEALTASQRAFFWFVKVTGKVDMSVCLRKQKKVL